MGFSFLKLINSEYIWNASVAVIELASNFRTTLLKNYRVPFKNFKNSPLSRFSKTSNNNFGHLLLDKYDFRPSKIERILSIAGNNQRNLVWLWDIILFYNLFPQIHRTLIKMLLLLVYISENIYNFL